MPPYLHNSEHTKHTHETRVQNTRLYSDDTTHIKQHRSVLPNASPARTITVSLDMRKAFDTINIHTLIRKLLQTKIPGTIISSSQTTSRDVQPTQHSKVAFHKVASFHQLYLTFTLQTYHHPEHWFSSWSTLMTSPSHLHTQARVQP